MIKKRKRQLSNYYVLACLIFFPTLPALFFYAFNFNLKFSYIIVLAYSILAIAISIFITGARRRERLIFLQRQDCEERKNVLTNGINAEENSVNALLHKIMNYISLKSVTERLSKCLSLDDTSQALTVEACNLLGDHDKICILYLFEPRSAELGIIATRKGRETEIIKAKKGDIFDSWVMKKLQPLIVEDAKKDFRFDSEALSKSQTRQVRSLISSPLIVGRQVLGILRADSSRENSFTFDDLRLLATISDIGAMAIENALLYERTEELAIRDGLTGLYLRRYLIERLTEEISRSTRREIPLSLLMLDIDYFKNYNDKFGHVAGDIVLRAIGKLLSENFSKAGNIVCRYGGEEFCVLIPNCKKEEALKLGEELRKRIEKEKIILRKKATQVSISIGIASFPVDAKIKDDLILRADGALYLAKQSGRNRVCLA